MLFGQSPETAALYAEIALNGKMASGPDRVIYQEVKDWLSSQERAWMIVGERYYGADPDILQRKRWGIGENGEIIEIKNVANNKLVNNFAKKLVDQKVGYLLAKLMTVQAENKQYEEILTEGYFNQNFQRMIQNLGKEAINKGRAWLHVYYDEQGRFRMKRIPSQEIIPLWRDADHTELDAVVRVMWYVTYEGQQKKEVAKIEYWDSSGIHRYVYEDDVLLPDVEFGTFDSHFVIVNPEGEEMHFNWTRPPFICWKYSQEEQPLLKQIKTLVDDYDKKKSDNSNAMEETPSDSIMILKNYDGTDLGEFRRNLAAYRAVKVSEDGGVDTLTTEVKTEAFKTHQDMNRKDIYEFGRGVDTQSEKFGGDQSGVALKFLYADLDMDCNMMETEFQWALGQLLWFINVHLANSGAGDFFNEKVTFIFNRDIPINETEAVKNAKDSVGIISDETIIANHPWTTNLQDELDRIQKQKEEMSQYPGMDDPNHDHSRDEAQ